MRRIHQRLQHIEARAWQRQQPRATSSLQDQIDAYAEEFLELVDRLALGDAVGRPVVDMLRQAGLAPIAVTIHGGDQVHRDGQSYRVPKRDLAGILQVLLQTQRLRVTEVLPMARTLVQELLNFKMTIDPKTAHNSYST